MVLTELQPPVPMDQVARVVGLSYDTFRRQWRTLVADEGLPAPFRLRPYLWRAEDLKVWQDRRVQELARMATAGADKPPAPAPRPARDKVADARRAMMARIRSAA